MTTTQSTTNLLDERIGERVRDYKEHPTRVVRVTIGGAHWRSGVLEDPSFTIQLYSQMQQAHDKNQTVNIEPL